MGRGGYLYVVNGTPYKWNKVDSHRYQMLDVVLPDSIDAFSVKRLYFEFEWHLPAWYKDDEAWAEYAVATTNSRFRLWANAKSGDPNFKLQLVAMSTMSDSQGSQIDLGFRENPKKAPIYNAVTCIIAGTDGAFVSTSVNSPRLPWMSSSLGILGGRTLREICVPGTHNSGMSLVLPGKSTAFGWQRNTVCQSRSIGEQLRLGVRYFDFRPVISGGEFTAGHYGDTHSKLGWQGASGQYVREMVEQINEYTRDNAEVVVLSISHAYNTDAGSSYRGLTHDEWERLFREHLDHLNFRYTAVSPQIDLSLIPLRDFIGSKQAAVILRFESDGEPGHLPQLGHRFGNGYFYAKNLPIYDQYGDTNDPENLVQDQFGKLQREKGNAAANMSNVFCIGWALTPKDAWDSTVGPSLLDWARDCMTPRLGPELFGKSAKTCYPNIIGLDGVETTDALAVAIAINTRACL